MYTVCPDTGKRLYTLKKAIVTKPASGDQPQEEIATHSAHPARFSPDDKFSKYRVGIKKRFGILPIQLAPIEY